MAAKRVCPACGQKTHETATRCPKCQTQLEILYWEIEETSGDKTLYEGDNAEPALREQLIAGTRKLSDRCRQYSRVLERVDGEQKEYGLGKEKEWKTLKDYASDVFSLHVLFDPVQAYGKKAARITWVVVGVVVAVAWDMDILLLNGANPFVALIISIVLLALTPTVVGLIIGSVAVGAAYGLPGTGMGFRSVVAVITGLLVGAAVGWTLGFVGGAIIGSTKPKVLEG